jgi:gamma-glutamylcyclotransferase (GGCT)/AIG2-like uncharacterized protein YtfP
VPLSPDGPGKPGHDTIHVTMTELLFSYGTLQQEGVQLAQFGRKLSGQPDALVGWHEKVVEITDPEVLAKSGKRFHPIVTPGRKDDQVPGMVFEVTAEELAAADAYEVSDYKRVSARLASGKTAWVCVKA